MMPASRRSTLAPLAVKSPDTTGPVALMDSKVVPEGGGEGDMSGKPAGVAPAPPAVAAGPAGPAGAWSPCWRSTAEPTTARTTMTTMTPIDALRSQWDSLRGGVTCAVMGLLCTDA